MCTLFSFVGGRPSTTLGPFSVLDISAIRVARVLKLAYIDGIWSSRQDQLFENRTRTAHSGRFWQKLFPPCFFPKNLYSDLLPLESEVF